MIRTPLKGYVIRSWPPSPIPKAWPWLGRSVSAVGRQGVGERGGGAGVAELQLFPQGQ